MLESNTYLVQLLQRKFGSADWDKWAMHRWSYYDYVRLTNAGVNSLSFFAVAVGGTDPVSNAAKTREQTNAEKTRSFGQVYYVIQQVRTHVHVLPKNRQLAGIADDADVITTTYSAMMPELMQLAGMGVLRIQIAAKQYFEINQPFKFAPPGMGVEICQHASAQTTEAMWWQQSPCLGDCYPLTPPQLIEPEQTFEANIEFPNANTPTIPTVSSAAPRIDIGLIFDGYIIRPAQ